MLSDWCYITRQEPHKSLPESSSSAMRFLLLSLFLSTCEARGIVHLRGAGASFPSPVYSKWLTSYEALRINFVDVNASYVAVGSGRGVDMMIRDRSLLEFAGTDLALTEEESIGHPDLRLFPVIAGAVVVSFNLPGISSLNLTKETLVGIYNGTVSQWDDLRIVEWNPGINLPHETIQVLARGDKSGTTSIFTSALSEFSPEWKATRGTFSKGVKLDDSNGSMPNWDPDVIAYAGYGNRGMSGLLLSIPYCIGYVSIADATEAGIPFATLVSESGSLLKPAVETVQIAMDSAITGCKDFRTGIPLGKSQNDSAYPIAGFSYFLMSFGTSHICDSAVELVRFMDWFMNDPAAINDCVSLGFVPVTSAIAKSVLSAIETNYTCAGDLLVSELVEQQIQDEKNEQMATLISVLRILGASCGVILCILATFITWSQVKENAALLKKAWRIQFELLTPINNAFTSMYTSMFSVDSTKPGMSQGCLTGQILRLKENLVWIQQVQIPASENLKLSTKKFFLLSQRMNHQNVCTFYGITSCNNLVHFVMEFQSNATLYDVLHSGKYDLDNNLKYCLSLDVANGMIFLHNKGIVCGNLFSAFCIIDSKWNVKVGNWMYCPIAEREKNLSILTRKSGGEDTVSFSRPHIGRKLSRAPELVNNEVMPSKQSDVYSFAFLLAEVFTQVEPFSEDFEDFSCIPNDNTSVRSSLWPMLSQDSPVLQRLIRQCLQSDPILRPSFSQVAKNLKIAKPSSKGLLDGMMDAVKGYVERLEEMVKERTAELTVTSESMRTLLHQILPPKVAEKLQRGQAIEPESFTSVTVFFSDIVGFTNLSSTSTPTQIIHFLNTLYTCFDEILDKHDVYKVETIGDAYMVISGLPERNGMRHAGCIAQMALELMEATKKYTIPHRPKERLQLRAGAHSGSVAAGVVGTKMPRYCLFGDTVNTASRMESTSLANCIQVSEDFKTIVDKDDIYILERRGKVYVKGKGDMVTYWLIDKKL